MTDLILDDKVGVDDAPLLFNLANDGPWRTGDLQLLETAGKAAALTPERCQMSVSDRKKM